MPHLVRLHRLEVVSWEALLASALVPGGPDTSNDGGDMPDIESRLSVISITHLDTAEKLRKTVRRVLLLIDGRVLRRKAELRLSGS
jgi:hypothetical protein